MPAAALRIKAFRLFIRYQLITVLLVFRNRLVFIPEMRATTKVT
jgi:hypothetical protein